jgi:glycosyltransferase involved in cell wall biosynthesis
MDISVVVTNYNYGKFLGRCVRSLLSQNIEKSRFEIIVVDDSSTDGSIRHLETYKKDLIVLPLEKNFGLGYAANVGMRAAKNRYIVRVDSDDYVHSSFLSTLLLGFELSGRDYEAVSCDYMMVDQDGDSIKYGNAELEPIACGIAFKADILENLGYYDGSLRIDEDLDLKRRFNDEGYRIKNIQLPLYRYVKHNASLSRGVII